MSDIKTLTQKIAKFRDARDWKQFNTPKDLALSLVLETAELLEHFQWKSPQEIDDYIAKHKNDISEELADVFYYVLLISHDFGIDIKQALERKLVKNEQKYPVTKSRGNHKKYSEL